MNMAVAARAALACGTADALLRAARVVSAQAFANAAAYDDDFAYPAAEIDALRDAKLLTAVLPLEFGGLGVTYATLCDVLRQIGSGSLPLGRLFEGHVNAIGLVVRYGRPEQISLLAREAHAGKISGVWNTDDSRGLRLISSSGGLRLMGRKILASDSSPPRLPAPPA